MAVPHFLIKNGSADFQNKQKNLFDVLSSVEKEKTPSTAQDNFIEVEQKSNKRKRKETKHFRGKESLFKEPVDLPLRFFKNNKMPDFQRNPHKWTKYSLANVTQDEMSNESNTAAALSFLKEIHIQKKQRTMKLEEDKLEIQMSCTGSHQFSKLHKTATSSSDDDYSHKPYFRSTKLIMPEYIVGQAKKIKRVSKNKLPSERNKEVFLNHIHEYEDE